LAGTGAGATCGASGAGGVKAPCTFLNAGCAALAAICAALTDDGRFAFETRNRLAREWEKWIPANVAEVTDHDGRVVRMFRTLETPVAGDSVSFTHTFSSPGWNTPQTSRSTLRFLEAERLASFLSEAGLAIEEQFGDWDGSAFTAESPEIITIARRD